MSHSLAALAVALGLLATLAPTDAKLGPSWRELDGYTFEQYKLDFGKEYSCSMGEAAAEAAFLANLLLIRAHNADPTMTWKMGVNYMTDLTPADLQVQLGYNKAQGALRRSSDNSALKWESIRVASSSSPRRMGAYSRRLPYEVDWRKDGVVTSVKNQGQCGSCWAFAAAAALESHLAIATGELYVLSVQEFVSCVDNPRKCGGTGGCGGSIPQLAFDYAKANGMTEEWSYSYGSFHGAAEECRAINARDAIRGANVVGHYDLPTNDQDALLDAIAFDGPVSISVDASKWHLYEEGVFDGCNQTNPDINHAVQLVGYGTDAKEGDYWLVRNSWSPMWGERGYIRLRRESTPRCGVDIHPEHGTGCEGGPKQVEVCGTCGILYDNTIPIFERTASAPGLGQGGAATA